MSQKVQLIKSTQLEDCLWKFFGLQVDHRHATFMHVVALQGQQLTATVPQKVTVNPTNVFLATFENRTLTMIDK